MLPVATVWRVEAMQMTVVASRDQGAHGVLPFIHVFP